MKSSSQAIDRMINVTHNEVGILEFPDSGVPYRKKNSSLPDINQLRKHYTRLTVSFFIMFVIAIVWVRLDYMNQLELQDSEQIHDSIKQARAEGQKRIWIDSKFENLIKSNLNHCLAAAVAAKSNYLNLYQDALRNMVDSDVTAKLPKARIPRSVESDATWLSGLAQADCQKTYETQLINGK